MLLTYLPSHIYFTEVLLTVLYEDSGDSQSVKYMIQLKTLQAEKFKHENSFNTN